MSKKAKVVDINSKQEATTNNPDIIFDGQTAVDLSYIGSKDEQPEARNVKSRERVRSNLEGDIEAFLKSGGNIDSIEPNVMADPPRKPENSYGSRPI